MEEIYETTAIVARNNHVILYNISEHHPGAYCFHSADIVSFDHLLIYVFV